MLFSTWPVIAFIRGPYRRAVRQASRRAKGSCLKCGYNLTGLVEPRCPECGTATNSLARVWVYMSKRHRAEPPVREALFIARKARGPEHAPAAVACFA